MDCVFFYDEKLGLKKCVDIVIGIFGWFRGIFGGEMKWLLFVLDVSY